MKILKFSQYNCAPCKAVNPVVAEFVTRHNAEYEEINCEDEPEIAGKYNIMGVPVVIVIDNGTEKRYTGERDILTNLK